MNKIESSNCRFFPACGGCAYLHLDKEEYQRTKIEGLNLVLKNMPIDDFFWIGPQTRRRIILQIDVKNNLGFFAKASKSMVAVDACYIAKKEISDFIPVLQKFIKTLEENLLTQITVTQFDNVIDVIFSLQRELNFTQVQKITEFARSNKINVSSRVKNNLAPIFRFKIPCSPFDLELDSAVFLQATKEGADKIISIINDFIENKFKDKKIFAADIYGGFGSYSFAIADHVKEIEVFEGDEKMVQLIARNSLTKSLSSRVKGQLRDLFFLPLTAKELEKFDLVIINPPRNGAGPQALEIAKSKLQNLIYVSCNPQSFARDAKILLDGGFKIGKITAIDQFYGSAHLELVAEFTR